VLQQDEMDSGIDKLSEFWWLRRNGHVKYDKPAEKPSPGRGRFRRAGSKIQTLLPIQPNRLHIAAALSALKAKANDLLKPIRAEPALKMCAKKNSDGPSRRQGG